MTTSVQERRRGDAMPVAGSEGARPAEKGFTLVDSLIACALLITGTLSAAMVGVYSSNLQLRIADYSAAHMIASDIIEKLRNSDLNAMYTQYTATPTVTDQNRQVTVTFPQSVMDQTFYPTVTVATGLAAGFLPVRISVRSGQQTFLFSTFVGRK
ncbi:MAG TPA: hypothetical protein VK348_11465 [Planctomycetota bacterium]|nr:hypothetical protein [Planctomycetota bacterium]